MSVYVSQEPFPIDASEISATDSPTTTSGTDSIMTTMTATPTAGTYMVFFGTTITSSQAGAVITVSLYVNTTQKADSVRKIAPFDGGTLSALTARGSTDINALLILNGTDVVTIQWNTTAGTATSGPRTLNLLRIA